MRFIKLLIHKFFKKIGFDIVKYQPAVAGPIAEIPFGSNPFEDIHTFLKNNAFPVIFDVGGNVGQSVDEFKKIFPDSSIDSFEPGPDTFAKLREHCMEIEKVKVWNFAIGSCKGILPFQENTRSVMSSFYSPGENWWGEIKKVTNVEVTTLDAFAEQQKVNFIDILKSDTQGFDLEVFKGAERLINENRIGVILCEIIYSNIYEGTPSFTNVLSYLLDHNFLLVGFYSQCHQNHLLSWSDALFINTEYKKKIMI